MSETTKGTEMNNARTMDLLQGCKTALEERDAQIAALAAKAEAYDLFKDLIGLVKPACDQGTPQWLNMHYHITRMMDDLRAEDDLTAKKAGKEDPEKENLSLSEAITPGALRHVRDGILHEVSPSADDDWRHKLIDHIRNRMDMHPMLILTPDSFDAWLAEQEGRS